MARICFTWELGQGYGHLVRYATLIQQLTAAGHHVTFLSKEPERATNVFGEHGVEVDRMPTARTPADQSLDLMNSYPEVISNVGFADKAQLAHHLQTTVEAIEQARPDLLIIDHSPSALLANQYLRLPAIFSGTGFTVPPRAQPMPPLRYWTARFRDALPDSEQRVLDAMNHALEEFRVDPLPSFASLFCAEREWILSFPELDHYAERAGGRYLGSFPAAAFGIAPQWPATDGPKVFAYLSAATVAEELWNAFETLNASVCLYAPALAPADRRLHERIYFADNPVDLALAGEQCDLAISNSSLNTVAGFMLSGTPQLVLPTNLERYMVGRRVELLGAGLILPPRKPAQALAKLRALTHERRFKRAAESFAHAHASASAEQQLAMMIDDIEGLLET